ncbi:MAG TPA: glycosyltransferase family 2 protein [Chloroflexota bacterium]|nr:glycosyltransferase family 2 protein [Chloroflexota bacterium]
MKLLPGDAPLDSVPFLFGDVFAPVCITEVDLAEPIPLLRPSPSGESDGYSRALSLVWVHDHPIGLVQLAIPPGGLNAEQYARQIWRQIGDAINTHLTRDGLPSLRGLTAAGIGQPGNAGCWAALDAARASGPRVSVVIPTRNRPDQIVACITSVLRQDYPAHEIIVADNGPCSSETQDAVARNFDGELRVRYVREEVGGTSRARNRGIQLAQGDIIAFCDDDVRHDRRWLLHLVLGFGMGDRVGCVTGLVLPHELETEPQVWLEQYGGYSKGFVQQIYDLDEHVPQDRLFPFTTGRLGTGANMAFRTQILRSLGGFDIALGGGSPAIGGEDLAMSFQIIAAGFQLVYQPAAVVYHPHYRDYAALRRQMYGYGKGLTAYLTKCLIDNPRLGIDMLRKLPFGLDYLFSPRSRKNRRKSPNYPRELTMIELKGMMDGPFAYVRGRWARDRGRATSTILAQSHP